MISAQLSIEGDNLLDKLADNAANFPTPSVTDLTLHQGQMVTQFAELAGVEGQVDSKRQQIQGTVGLMRGDMNAIDDWGEA